MLNALIRWLKSTDNAGEAPERYPLMALILGFPLVIVAGRDHRFGWSPLFPIWLNILWFAASYTSPSSKLTLYGTGVTRHLCIPVTGYLLASPAAHYLDRAFPISVGNA